MRKKIIESIESIKNYVFAWASCHSFMLFCCAVLTDHVSFFDGGCSCTLIGQYQGLTSTNYC